jgi:hypothetical protein
MMNWKRCVRNGRGLIQVLSGYLPGGGVENHQQSQDGWCTGQDSSPAPPKVSLQRYRYKNLLTSMTF